MRPRGHATDHEQTLDELLDENLRDASGYPAFASDPPNPLDPHPPPLTEVEEAEIRRRPGAPDRARDPDSLYPKRPVT